MDASLAKASAAGIRLAANTVTAIRTRLGLSMWVLLLWWLDELALS